MRVLKYAGIWLVSLLLIVLAVNFGFGLVVDHFLGNTFVLSLSGYSRKMTFPLPEPVTEQQEKENGGVILIRTLVCTDTLVTEPEDIKFPYFDMTVDESMIFLNPEGRHALSSGIYATVYHDLGEDNDYVKHAVGLLEIGELSRQDGAMALCEALEAEPDAVIRLDAYTLEESKVTPVQITVLDQSGNELLVSDFQAEGDVIREDNCYIKNKSGVNDGYDVGRRLRRAFEGEKDSDRIAEEYAAKVTPGSADYQEDHFRFGAACVTRILISALDGNTGIYAIQMHYPTALILYSAVLGLIMTVILTVIFIKRR